MCYASPTTTPAWPALGLEEIDTSEIGLVEGWMQGRDTDEDGLDDCDEMRDLDPYTYGVQIPFDPDVADSTGDEFDPSPDGIPDGQNDWDSDGLSNADEIEWGNDPTDPLSSTEFPLSWWAAAVALLSIGLLLLRTQSKDKNV